MELRSLVAHVVGRVSIPVGLVLFALFCSGASFADHHAGTAEPKAAEAPEPAAPKPFRTKSGLIYTELKAGVGRHPRPADRVKVHYTGTFPNGRVFDSSVERGKPAVFALNRVIKCWTEGLQLMKAGGSAKFVCPAKIAYGERGSPPNIPPNARLYFEVDLISIQ